MTAVYEVCIKYARYMKRKRQEAGAGPSGNGNAKGRERLTITLERETRRMGVELARGDGRDLSHEIEWLIKAEHARVHGRKAA